MTQTLTLGPAAALGTPPGPWVASTQAVTLGVAPAVGFLAGPTVAQSGATPPEWVPRVTCSAWSRNGVLTATMADSFAPTWQDRHNEVGSGQAQMENDDAELALIDYRHVIRFDLDGAAVDACLVEHIDTVALATGEEVDEVTTLGGRGRLAILEEAIVAPYGGESRTQFQADRLFNFAAPELDDSGWSPVVTRVQALNPEVDPGSHNTVPQGWPDPDALKIWQSWPIGARAAPVGDVSRDVRPHPVG